MHWIDSPPGDDHLLAAVRAEAEKASGQGISVSNPLPGEWIAEVQTLQPEGCTLNHLLLWMYTEHPEGWSAPAFRRWFRAFQAVREAFRAMRIEARPL